MEHILVTTHKRGVSISVIPKVSKELTLEAVHESHWSCKEWSGNKGTFIHTMGFSDSLGLNGDSDE